MSTDRTTSSPAKDSLRQEQKEQRENAKGKDGALDQALEDTFPASDPVAAQAPTKPGAKKISGS